MLTHYTHTHSHHSYHTRITHRFVLEAEPSLDCIIQLPAQCPSKTGDERTCRSTNFPEVEGFSYFTEYQEISIQERGATEGAAATPVGVQVHLFDELADRCKAGGMWVSVCAPD